MEKVKSGIRKGDKKSVLKLFYGACALVFKLSIFSIVLV